MFTGIVEEVGTVSGIVRGARSSAISIKADRVLEGARVGDSICVSGVCLTVSELAVDRFTADVMPETMERSTLGQLRQGSPVNLEPALRLGGRLGGHLVSGHIDGTARVVEVRPDDNAVRLSFAADQGICRLMVEKGSVALDGISLTVTDAGDASFSVSVIPHTFASTTMHERRAGDLVNVECDIIGKYVERLLDAQEARTGLTMEFLAQNGF